MWISNYPYSNYFSSACHTHSLSLTCSCNACINNFPFLVLWPPYNAESRNICIDDFVTKQPSLESSHSPRGATARIPEMKFVTPCLLPPPPMHCSSSSFPLRFHPAVGMGSHFFRIWFLVGSPLLPPTFSFTSLQLNCLCLINNHVISLLDSVDVWITLTAFWMLNSVKFLNKAVCSGVLFPFKNITEFGLHISCLGYFNLHFEWDLFTIFTSFCMHLKLWIILYAN